METNYLRRIFNESDSTKVTQIDNEMSLILLQWDWWSECQVASMERTLHQIKINREWIPCQMKNVDMIGQ